MTETETIMLYNGTVVEGPKESYDAAMILRDLISDEMREKARALRTLGMYADKKAAELYAEVFENFKKYFEEIGWSEHLKLEVE